MEGANGQAGHHEGGKPRERVRAEREKPGGDLVTKSSYITCQKERGEREKEFSA